MPTNGGSCPRFPRAGAFSDLQGCAAVPAAEGGGGARGTHGHYSFKKDGGTDISTTHPTRAHGFSPLLPFVLSLPTPGPGCACDREPVSVCPRAGTRAGLPSILTAPCRATRSPEGSVATRAHSRRPHCGARSSVPVPGRAGGNRPRAPSGAPRRLRGGGDGSPPARRLPKTRRGWEPSALGAPPGTSASGATTDKQIFADSSQAYEQNQPSSCPLTPAARLPGVCSRGGRSPACCPLLSGPAGLGVPLPAPGRHRGCRPPPPHRREKPRAGWSGWVLTRKRNHFLNFHLDYIVLLLWACPAARPRRFMSPSTASTVKSQRSPGGRPLPQSKQGSAGAVLCCAPGPEPPSATQQPSSLLQPWMPFSLEKEKEGRGSLRSIYIHIFSIKTIK